MSSNKITEKNKIYPVNDLPNRHGIALSSVPAASSIEGDGKYHRCQGTFKTSDKLNSCGLFIYNRNSTDTVSVGDIKLVKLSGKPEAEK